MPKLQKRAKIFQLFCRLIKLYGSEKMNIAWLKKKQQLKISASLLCLLLILSACQINLKMPKSKQNSPWLFAEEQSKSLANASKEQKEPNVQQLDKLSDTSNTNVTEASETLDREPKLTEAIQSGTEAKQPTTESTALTDETAINDLEHEELSNINHELATEENKLVQLSNLPKRNIVEMQRIAPVEQELRRIINEERDKVGLAAYFDNPTLTLTLETQVVYNMRYMLAKNFTNGPANALFLALHSDKVASNQTLSDYFSKQLVENEANRIFLIGDGYDQLSLLLLYCQRVGDEQTHHYVLSAMPWRANWATELNLQKNAPEVNGHLLENSLHASKKPQTNNDLQADDQLQSNKQDNSYNSKQEDNLTRDQVTADEKQVKTAKVEG